MLFANTFCPKPQPEYRPLRKADEAESQMLYAMACLQHAGLVAGEPEPLTLGQQFAAWRARRKANA